jgi:hypothetical protein
MIFVIDTTELHDQKRLEGNLFRLFLLAKNLTKHRVCIPEVVLAEHHRASRAAMQRSASTIEKEAKVLARYWDKVDVTLPPVEQEFQKWRSWIDERLRVAGVEILPYPTTPHRSIADRDLARRKPFSETGKGYRDALIWESVLELATANVDDVVFITSNSGDFSDSDELHPDLVKDLVDRELEKRVSLAVGLSNALEKHLKHLLPATDQQLRAALERGPADGIDLMNWALRDLKDVCPKLRVPPTPGLEHEYVSLSTVRSVESLKVREARRFQTGEVFVEMELAIVALVTLPSEPPSESPSEVSTNAWRLLATVLASLFHSQSIFRMSVALTFGRDRVVLAADVWDLRVSAPLAALLPKPSRT